MPASSPSTLPPTRTSVNQYSPDSVNGSIAPSSFRSTLVGDHRGQQIAVDVSQLDRPAVEAVLFGIANAVAVDVAILLAVNFDRQIVEQLGRLVEAAFRRGNRRRCGLANGAPGLVEDVVEVLLRRAADHVVEAVGSAHRVVVVRTALEPILRPSAA